MRPSLPPARRAIRAILRGTRTAGPLQTGRVGGDGTGSGRVGGDTGTFDGPMPWLVLQSRGNRTMTIDPKPRTPRWSARFIAGSKANLNSIISATICFAPPCARSTPFSTSRISTRPTFGCAKSRIGSHSKPLGMRSCPTFRPGDPCHASSSHPCRPSSPHQHRMEAPCRGKTRAERVVVRAPSWPTSIGRSSRWLSTSTRTGWRRG